MACCATNLVLMGLRASGKTTLGRLAADALGWAFVDLDDRTAALLGAASPAAALTEAGEAAFRAAEVNALRATLADAHQVVALGGGTPTAPGASELLGQAQHSGAGRVVYLHLDPQRLAQRLARTDLGARPSLTGRGVIAEIDELYAARDGLYRRLADAIINPADLTIDQTLAALLDAAGL